MNAEHNIRRAMKTARLNRRAYGSSCKGLGKKAAHKSERRVNKALTREEA